MVGFVDDSTGQVNDFLSNIQPSPNQLTTKMQEDAQLWSDLLWVSGGKLELAKCSYHYLHFDFFPSGAPTLRPLQVGPPIRIRDP